MLSLLYFIFFHDLLGSMLTRYFSFLALVVFLSTLPSIVFAQGALCTDLQQPADIGSLERALERIGYNYYCAQNIGDINSDGANDWYVLGDDFISAPIMLTLQKGGYIPARISREKYLFDIDAKYLDGQSEVWHRFKPGILVKVTNGPNTEDSKWGDYDYDEQDLLKCKIEVYKWNKSAQYFQQKKQKSIIRKYKKRLCYTLKIDNPYTTPQSW